MTIVALGISSRVVVGAAFLIILIITALWFCQRKERVSLGKYTILVYATAILSLLYLTHLEDLSTFVNFANFFVPAFYLVMFSVLFSKRHVNRDIARFFTVVFVLETAFILIEVFDGLIGFDIHGTWIIRFFLENDGRFTEQCPQCFERIEDLPIALGVHGFPHYTAPIYVVSFAFAIASAFSSTRVDGRLSKAERLTAASFFFAGVFCIYMLGVKTHFITALIAIVIVGLVVRRTVFFYVAVAGLLLVVGTLVSPWATNRVETLKEQVFIGNDIEGSRLDVIFKFEEYRALLDLSPWEMVVGKGGFADLAEFTDRGYFLEQKLLLFALVLGPVYMLLILTFYAVGLHCCWRVYRRSTKPLVTANAIAIACSLVVFLADIGHFGYSMITPNIQVLFVMLAAIGVIERSVESENTAPLAAPRGLRPVYRRSVHAPVGVPQVVLKDRMP